MQKSNIRRLTVTAILLALATVLSLIKIWSNPWGGSVTLFSMVPIIIISLIFSIPWSLFASFVYALIQIGVDIAGMMGWGMDVRMWIGAIIFDYLLAYTIIGISGVFAKKGMSGIIFGTSLAFVSRFLSHFISGYIFFDIWMPEEFVNPAVYSAVYNATYILPELVLTLIAVILLVKTNTLSRLKQLI